jgi:cell pole-organizing protein PopZ
MEEILASIRRIISEDGDGNDVAPAPAPAPAAAKPAVVEAPPKPVDDVLELTNMVPEEPSFAPEPSWSDPVPEPPPPRPASRPAPTAYVDDDSLISPQPAAQAAAHFAQMYSNAGIEKAWPLGNHIRTVEDVVKDLLRPLLKEWLDENLPSLVERLVQRELDRMGRRAGYE